MKVTYSQIRAFNAVARTGSFSKAANVLGVTQPAITLQVRALEDTYAVVLFIRSREVMTLTKLGQELYETTQSIHMMETEADNLLSRQSALTDGSLSLAAGSPNLIMPLIKNFHGAYPGVKISLQLGNYEAMNSALLQNQVDVAVLDGPIQNERYHSQLFLQQELVLIVPVGHKLASQERVRPDDLVTETVLVRGDGSYTQKTMEEWFGRARVNLSTTIQMSSRDSVIEAASCGLGVGFVFDKELGNHNAVSKIRLSGHTTRCNESLVCLKSQIRRKTVKAMFEML